MCTLANACMVGFRDVEQIKQTTKQEIIDIFMKHVHYSSKTRSKLSIHMDSQVPSTSKGPVQELMDALAAKHVPVSEDGVKELGDHPSTADVQAFARDCLVAASEIPEKDRAELETAVAAFKAPEAVALRETNVYIEDIVGWKASLKCSAAARPVERLVARAE